LMNANMAAKAEDRLPEEELLGQMNMLIFAGHETTTSATCRALHLLAMNPNVQAKLREEVKAARLEHGDMDYDTLMGLPYLDAVCRETLRLYAPVTTQSRVTRKDTVLPLLWPVKSADGETPITEIPLKTNTKVIMSLYNANRCKTAWGEDADEWKPERWLSSTPDNVSKARFPGVYSSMMTFLGGGRACIGFKFAETEMKLVLATLLETFEFAPSSKEVYWMMSTLSVPVLENSEDRSVQLPLKVTFVKQ